MNVLLGFFVLVVFKSCLGSLPIDLPFAEVLRLHNKIGNPQFFVNFHFFLIESFIEREQSLRKENCSG